MLTPEHMGESIYYLFLVIKENPLIKFHIEASSKRIYSDKEYESQGGIIVDSILDCDIILGVKEIPTDKLFKNKTYMFFSHTFKA